jgi:4-hydroxy-tetrahydrodipicolinate synthase
LDHKKQVLNALIQKGIPPQRLVVGVGHSSIEETVDMVREALRHKVLAVLWHPPFYFKNLSDDGVIAFYKECLTRINDKSLKVILYNFPANTGVPVNQNIVGKLYDMFPDNIKGVKDSSFSFDHTLGLIQKVN